MTTLLRLDASIRGNESVTRTVADSFEAAATDALGTIEVVRRDLARDPIDARTWALSAAASQSLVPDYGLPEERSAAVATATAIGADVERADAYLIAAPFYNFGVSQHVKTWADVLLTNPQFGPGSQPIAGRPAYVVTARGGGYGPGTPRHGWDHGTDWLRRIFGDVLGLDVHLIETELTLAPVTPGMEDLRDLAASNLEKAHRMARDCGRIIADRLRVAA